MITLVIADDNCLASGLFPPQAGIAFNLAGRYYL